jgi:hypothetical protein
LGKQAGLGTSTFEQLGSKHSYVRNRQIRAEVSQCQRWVELRIGEWLGPAKAREETGRGKSSPGDEIHNRHKHEFRFMAEHKEIVTDIMKNQPGREITRMVTLTKHECAIRILCIACMQQSAKVRVVPE